MPTQSRTAKGFGIAVVEGLSMIPTYAPGDRVLVRYGARFSVGDVVLVRHDNRIDIKRIREIQGDQVFVEGDNHYVSTDSRSYGAVPTSAVIGRAIWRIPSAKRSR